MAYTRFGSLCHSTQASENPFLRLRSRVSTTPRSLQRSLRVPSLDYRPLVPSWSHHPWWHPVRMRKNRSFLFYFRISHAQMGPQSAPGHSHSECENIWNLRISGWPGRVLLGTRLGPVWDLSRTCPGPVWDLSGTGLGPVLGPVWDRSGTGPGTGLEGTF